MRITYVTRSFLDYRVPVLEALCKKLNNEFHVIYSSDYIPDRVNQRIKRSLGPHAIGMTGEKRIGANAISATANSGIRIVYQPGLAKEIEKTRPDVVVGDGFFQWTVFALKYKLLHKVPLVICYERTFHTERNAQWVRTIYRKILLRFVDAMAVNGKLCLEYSKSLGMPESNITTGQMVADIDNLANISASIPPSQRANLRQHWDNPELVFLAVGKIIAAKGVKQLIDGWAKLEQEKPGKRALVFVGTGTDDEKFRSYAQEAGLKNVFFEGAVDYNKLPIFYASSDVFVMPSLEDNWSLVVPEAMACGLPVLCSIYNGCYPELVEEGMNGWVFDPLDINDTHRVLTIAADQYSNLKTMGIRSKQIANNHRPAHAADAIIKACKIACQTKNRNK